MQNSCSVFQCYVSMRHARSGVSTVWGTAQYPCSDSPHLMGIHKRKHVIFCLSMSLVTKSLYGDKNSVPCSESSCKE